MSTVEQAHKLWALANLYQLDGLDFAWDYTLEKMAEAYNGCGPEWFPQGLRDFLDEVFDDFQPAFFLHDLRWAHSDGSGEWFRESNEELGRNCRRIAAALYPWWRPKRWIRNAQATRIAYLCQIFGRSAYHDAFDMSVKSKKENGK